MIKNRDLSVGRIREFIPFIYLFFVILLWGSSPLVVTELSGNIPVSEIAFMATGFAVLIHFSLFFSETGLPN